MIAGDITAPSCYLDAIEILRRQYLAFLFDKAAQGPDGLIPNAGLMPRTIGQVAATAVSARGLVIGHPRCRQGRGDGEARFVALFGNISMTKSLSD